MAALIVNSPLPSFVFVRGFNLLLIDPITEL